MPYFGGHFFSGYISLVVNWRPILHSPIRGTKASRGSRGLLNLHIWIFWIFRILAGRIFAIFGMAWRGTWADWGGEQQVTGVMLTSQIGLPPPPPSSDEVACITQLHAVHPILPHLQSLMQLPTSISTLLYFGSMYNTGLYMNCRS